ncbi:MAG TPA: HAMP domain-containing sensor histidine kinase [Chloroflexota bacterium]|nr:HAMP domain-containing sensor histidine kinase [Chloroflexota bacterium]
MHAVLAPAHHQRSRPTPRRRPWWRSRPKPSASPRDALALVAATLLAAMLVDYLAPWPYVMTPLYVIPILLAAHALSPRATAGVAAVATLINILSGLLQGTPLLIHAIYSVALVLTDYLAVAFAAERQRAARHAQAAEAAHERLQFFMRCVVHELGNPLTVLGGYVSRLHHQQGLSPEAEQYVVTLEHTAERLKCLVRDLRDAGHLGTDYFQIHPAPTDLVAVARDVLALRQASTDDHQLRLDAPTRLVGVWDEERISQLLANLISNAIKYSPAGGPVQVTITSTAAEAHVSVADQGLGIPPDQMDDIFRPFERLHTDEVVEGLGLGLTIAKGIVEAHGGRIWVESAPGQGSTFHFTLPLRAGVVA